MAVHSPYAHMCIFLYHSYIFCIMLW